MKTSTKETYIFRLFRIAYVPIIYHVTIISKANPFLKDYESYFYKRKKLMAIIIGLGLLFGCNSNMPVRNFNIELRHFFGVEGYTLHYIINQDSLRLRYDCDFENCKDTLIYQIHLNQESVSDFYSFLINLKYDTLKSHYKTGGFDGRYTDVKINGDSIPSKKINLVRYQHETIEKLIENVDLLIPDIRYRLYRHKYEKVK